MKVFLIIFACLFPDTKENETQVKGSSLNTEQSECSSEAEETDFSNHFIIPNNLLLVN